ncbi:MAG TPA: glycosyltransferase family 4 protein [Pseudolabrys sp.]|nr:glycosyltransferase family 4 protein [Pseudolabrys sp.]
MAPLNILHVLRAPVGGLFRHVLDLSREQIARGHSVGLIADLSTGGNRADDALRQIEPSLALGLSRTPMPRDIGPGDAPALAHVMRRIANSKADVVHGHGAKGGAYARLAFGRSRALRVYTPHGGSLLYHHDTLAGKFYLTTERFLMRRGHLFLFESAFSAETFKRKIGQPRGLVRIVHNGVTPAEFEPVEPAADATDVVFIGELRMLKGIDVLIDAIASLRRDGRNLSATLVGDGPDRDAFHAQVERLGLSATVRFMPAMPARQAQALGRIMVAPSRAESLPYVVLEAAASGKPQITTRVGGIPEIYGPLSDRLVEPGDVPALARAIVRTLDHAEERTEIVRKLRERVATSFSVERMANGVLAGYAAALENLHKAGRR